MNMQTLEDITMTRVQVTITNKAEKLWKLVSLSKSKTIEQAIITLAQNKKLAPIFFDSMETVEAILNSKDDNSIPKKPKQNQSEKKDNNDQDEGVETAWG